MRLCNALGMLVSCAALAACGGSDDGEASEQVVAAFYPLAYAAERVAPTADVRNLTPAGAEPHDLELSPRDVEAIDDADLVLYLGDGFMPALEDAAREHENAVDLLEGVELVGRDQHVWLDPVRYARLVRRIGDALGEPQAADELVAELRSLDAEFRAGLQRCERRTIVTSHAAFAYLADAYDLEQVALTGLSPESEPSARGVERLVDEVREEGATTVFFETLVSPRLAETVAREAGARTAVLNPLEGLTKDEIEAGEDYVSVMRDNLAALRAALGCR
jgi:zinc transport system substrate-binding protein